MTTRPVSLDTADELPPPLLGEWACLGVIYSTPMHGWAVSVRLRPDGDVGRVWQQSRPLTYRSIDRLTRRRWIAPVGREPGDAGPNRTILAATPSGRTRLETWAGEPVRHLRDLRSELLLKLVIADLHGFDVTALLEGQRSIVDGHAEALAARATTDDVVALWRLEAARAAQRFIERVVDR